MKMYRFDNNPSQLPDCWQKSIVSTCSLTCFNDDLHYVLSELPRHERRYWLFGFTKPQFIAACKTFKQQAKFCRDKNILTWSKQSKLTTFDINPKDAFIFEDQVLFDVRKAKRL